MFDFERLFAIPASLTEISARQKIIWNFYESFCDFLRVKIWSERDSKVDKSVVFFASKSKQLKHLQQPIYLKTFIPTIYGADLNRQNDKATVKKKKRALNFIDLSVGAAKKSKKARA